VRHKLLAFLDGDPRELYEFNGDGKLRLRPLNELPERVRKTITKLKVDPETGTPVEITLAGKVEAAATLLRSLPGGDRTSVDVDGQIDVDINLAPLDHWRRTVFMVEAAMRSFDALPEFRQMLANSLREIADGNQAIEAGTPLERAKAAMLRLYGDIQELASDSQACDFLANYLTVTAQRIALPAQQGRGG
jgi:hypothetical protein